nr:hypothetical protein [Tanacetum cinerariifolium]
MCTYLKNLENYKHNQLKNKRFKEIQMLFNNTIKWIEAFVPMDTELVKDSDKAVKGSDKVVEGSEKAEEDSSKRAGSNLEQEDAKRQRLEEENESAELKRCLEIIHEDDDDVTIEATSLSSKSSTIIDYKIYKEGKKSFFKIIRADVYDAYNEVACLILGSMTHELHRQFENSSPCDMIKELKSMFEKQARVERFDLIQTFHACKQEEGKPVAKYILKMKGNLEQLERLGYVLPQDFRVGLILNGLTSDFAGFVYLKWTETPQVMMIKSGKIPKPKNPKPSAKEHPAKDDTCHHYKEVGHWKRNCHVYRAELLKKKKKVGTASSSGIFTIELFAFPNKSWVYDAGCGTHICITKQGFREARNLKQGALYLYVGNGVRVQVEAIGSYDLVLPNGFVICLDNCHYAPSITRGVVLVHRLVENGSVQCFTDFGISVSKKNVLYFNVIPSNGIYEIDMHDLVPDDNFIYNVSTKRAKHNLDSTYLWHYRLAHISNKRIEKLQQEGLLKSTDEESFDQCVSCLSGKMSRKSFSHRPEKVFKNEVKKQLGKTINALRSDRGRIHKPRVSGRAIDLEEIQDENTLPSEITRKIPMEVEGFEPPQEEVILVRRSERTHRAPNRLCINVEAKEHSLGDLNEPFSYKAAINKRIEKLQQDGLLKSTDDESFDQCVSCLSGKMSRKSFSHRPEKVTDLLGIVHTDVCGPLRHVSRKDASYFITFTDDYIHYGYVYLLKHKHEIEGEYISQEVSDYLKACGIVQQLTPPYTPQHNSVFEKRNRTLLDMVRSMMNLTTLPLSFWDYALESATRILNMVSTKKVDKIS